MDNLYFILKIIAIFCVLIIIPLLIKGFYFWWVFFPGFEKRYSLNNILYPIGPIARTIKVQILCGLAGEYFNHVRYTSSKYLKKFRGEQDIYYLRCKELMDKKKIKEKDLEVFYKYDSPLTFIVISILSIILCMQIIFNIPIF